MAKPGIGNRLRALRKRRRLTQAALAGRVGARIDCSYIGKIERGTQNPSVRTLRFIAQALDVPVGYFFAEGGGEAARYDVGSLLSDRSKRELIVALLDMESEDVVFLSRVARLLRDYRAATKSAGRRDISSFGGRREKQRASSN